MSMEFGPVPFDLGAMAFDLGCMTLTLGVSDSDGFTPRRALDDLVSVSYSISVEPLLIVKKTCWVQQPKVITHLFASVASFPEPFLDTLQEKSLGA